jgi:RNA polymerase subunit RPABC4/transcription elongation factor Spt4
MMICDNCAEEIELDCKECPLCGNTEFIIN